MESMLNSLFHDWDYLTTKRDELLRREPEYRGTERALKQAEEALALALGPENSRLLERYFDAFAASEALGSRVSLYFGARCALQLLLALLTP